MAKMQNITSCYRQVGRWLVMLLVISHLCACNQKNKEVQDQPIEQEAMPKWITSTYVMGKFDPVSHDDFVEVAREHADRDGLFLRREVYEAFKKMEAEASIAGVQLVIRSATRNFDYQKGIWERKWSGATILSDGTKASSISDPTERAKKILLYSSMPGTSRHHWGTDLDLNSFNNSYFEKGDGKRLYEWMKEHASHYGFCQPYTDKKDGRVGYEEERWHWTYVPTSKDLTRFSQENMSDDMISGFMGSEVARDLQVIKTYVLGIGKDCF